MEQEVSKRKEVQLFSNEEFGIIRTIVIDGNPWFVAKDVCNVLEVKNVSDAVNRLEPFERNTIVLNEGIGNPNKAIISESGFYALVLSSRKPIAKPFRIWVTSEVLPAIRKTGKYIASSSNKIETMITDMGCDLKIAYVQINNMEIMMEQQMKQYEETKAKLDKVMSNMTLTTVQQGKLQRAVKARVNYLLDGAHSQRYKDNSRLYFINLWNGLKEYFNCGSRWQDLNPKYFNQALDYISQWVYSE